VAELTVREIESIIVSKLEERAAQHSRTVEEEHKAILREVLVGGSEPTHPMSFERYLRAMPDVGIDADFSRVDGSFRPVDLAS
jgi:plasmid stability protein